jgi:hypothetical protein
MRKLGDMFDHLGKALEDGEVTGEEAREAELQIDRSIGALAALKASIRAQVLIEAGQGEEPARW